MTQNGFDRRTVVKGAAWSVPVLAAAVAAPLAAATGGSDADLAKKVVVSHGCLPILGSLYAGHSIKNNNSVPVTVTISQLLSVDSVTGYGADAVMDGVLGVGGWRRGWSGSAFPSSTCTNSGSLARCYRRETSRAWSVTIPAGGTVNVSRLLNFTITNNPTSVLTVSVGASGVAGSPDTFNPEILGLVC